MNAQYQNLRSKADRLYYRVNDCLDDKSRAGSLPNVVRDIVESFEKEVNPRSIEDRIKRAIDGLRSIHSDPSIMDTSDCEAIIHDYEDLRQDVRDLDNY